MPRKPDNTLKLWNLYIDENDKLHYLLELTKSGKQRCQSAGIRAMMHLYTVDEDVRNKVNSIIDNFVVEHSKL